MYTQNVTVLCCWLQAGTILGNSGVPEGCETVERPFLKSRLKRGLEEGESFMIVSVLQLDFKS